MVSQHTVLRQLPFQLRGSEADEGCMRENPPLATTGCDEVLCTAATETSKYHRTCQSTSRKDALEQFTKIMVSNEGKWVKKETPQQYDDIALARASSLPAGCLTAWGLWTGFFLLYYGGNVRTKYLKTSVFPRLYRVFPCLYAIRKPVGP